MVFSLVYVIFVQYRLSKRCSKNIRDRSKIEITRIIIINYIDKRRTYAYTSTARARARVPSLPRAGYIPNDV